MLHNELSLAELARLSSDVGSGKLQGLTSVEHGMAVRSRMGFSGDNPACVWFDELVVDLTPTSVDILVPSEYREGSCEHDAVLAHEREHEQIHRALLQAAAARIRERLAAARWLPARGNPIIAKDRKTASEELSQKAARVFRPPYEDFKEELPRQQASLDTPSHYDWVRRRCRDWK